MKETKGRADHIDQLVSRRLRMRRMMMGFSQQELSNAVEVSIQQVQKYEKAVNRISSGKLYGFAKFLKVPVSYFFENNDASGMAFSDDSDEYDKDEASRMNYASEKEVLSLIKSFSGIKNIQTRKKILELIKSM